jgi:nucleoside-diphosphate-sugar epimerase
MKIVVIGGTGLVGSKLVGKLLEHGHEAVPASPDSGVDTLTGEGRDRPGCALFRCPAEQDTLLPGAAAQLSATRFEEWLPLNPPPVK